MTGMTRSRATAAVPTASATCVTILKPAHRPKAREQRLRRARDRGRLAAGVVADDGQGAAGAGDADEVAVAERVGGAVEAGRLAVPHRQHAVYLAPGSCAASWLPQAEVAPSSSFRPGTWRTWCASTSSRLRASSLSSPPSGEPW